ncbi:uncharacterized protein [Rutidosis leptorrhynchoides]|uniref:uncharacterized protein n=1 Tax=Rutidosis leptorrhynchoides TaxID=125765 RepID=UPI003A98F54A
MVQCNCGRRACEQTSWTGRNLEDAIFLGSSCGFFRWIDPPMCDKSTNIIPGLLRSKNMLEVKVKAGDIKERRSKVIVMGNLEFTSNFVSFESLAIMTDAWSDRNRRSIMNLCVNSSLGNVFLTSKECSDEAHTRDYIYKYIEMCIEKVGPENVVQVVTDNAANNMGATKLLKLKVSILGGIGKKGFKKTLEEARKITVFIYSHHMSLALMRKYTKKRNIVRPGVTIFASSFLTLQSLLEKKTQLRHMV